MTDTINWLRIYGPGYRELSDDERQAIADFPVLWSLFEARVLNERGSAKAIIEAVAKWTATGQLAADTFGRELAYFRERYIADGVLTSHFYGLHLRKNDAPDLVKQALTAGHATPEVAAAAVLIIVYRFRNNLLHGVKWSYELRGQLNNFTHAKMALMRAIELHDGLGP